ncbi:MAG: type I phosphomannose isomerase catalytic subunit [Acidobacteriota bacterium]
MSTPANQPAPIPLRPIMDERVWGSTTLGPWYPAPEPGKPIGEAWLTAANCVVEAGPRQGATLAELTSAAPQAFGANSAGGFPLLVKVLFPREKLSVQVHPDDAGAQTLGMPNGKTECWYILSADPGATVAVGMREPLTAEQMREAIANGSIEEAMRHIPVEAGDMIFVDAGTVHALGPGVIVLETQQYSDATYRLYDYGRPRELHLDAGLKAARAVTQAGRVAAVAMDGFTRLIASPYFLVDRFSLEPDKAATAAASTSMQIFVALNDDCSLKSESGELTALPPGHAVVLPANAGEWTLIASTKAEVIRMAQP